MNGSLQFNGKIYYWKEISKTNEFEPLLHKLYKIVQPDVLRIWDEDSKFDIAIRIDEGTYYPDTRKRYLGPILVIGPNFPNGESPVEPGVLIRIRPKLRTLPEQSVNNGVAERIVQWALSKKFKAVKINAVEGLLAEHA